MPATLPLFPLQTVLLPGANLPLHVFEPRYRQLTVDLVTGTVPEKRFGVIAMKAPVAEEVDKVDQLLPIGCSAVLRQATRLPDGRYDIITTGERRFRLLDLDSTSAPYLIGTVDWIPDTRTPPAMAERIGSLADSARAAYRRYCDTAWEKGDWDEPADDTDPADLAHLLAADALLPIEDRQALLEETRAAHRLRMVYSLLTREAGIIAALRAVPAPASAFATKMNLN
ncbi:LON peptidase substrate-binding domain-containing protein [Kibdelosporangium phytohabitans]|uniref:LON peptidase substrate-binding domain-containing protein n=1 Tax=Kibdelosporangium phytohabitans TaxID=860235 RepID=UPI000A90FF09|nr:LON peptidase substrate-binding domain-containing protein [Kibdelosporangium phytohabitans]MBE1464504.1 Lon protease-like protein [Kibdelosporangium phytohabitans]